MKRRITVGQALLLVFMVLGVTLYFNPRMSSANKIMLNVDGVPTMVGETWQEWEVTYTDGSKDFFREYVPNQIVLDVVTTTNTAVKKPEGVKLAALYVKIPLKLGIQLRKSDSFWGNSWAEALWVYPTASVLINYRQVGAAGPVNQIIFTPADPIGAEKYLAVFISFKSGQYAPGGASLIELYSDLNGLDKAFVQIVSSQTWVMEKITGVLPMPWIPSDWYQTQSQSYVRTPVSTKVQDSPYGVAFDWSPGGTVTGTLTWPTGVITSRSDLPGTIFIVYTQTGTVIITVASNISITVYGPPTTVTRVIVTTRPSDGNGNGDGGGNGTASVSIWDGFVNWLKSLLPAGLQQYWWVLLIAVIVVAVWLLKKLFGGGGGGGVVVVR